MNQTKQTVLISTLSIIFFGLYVSTFIIPEGRQAVVTQFGKPVRTVRSAGLHWKKPFIQKVRMIDLRLLSWDGYPNQIPTKDKKYIEVDTTARWKIVDPLKFIQTVQNERGARTRLDAILDGVTRDVISNNNLVEAVRNSNTLLDQVNNSPAMPSLPDDIQDVEKEEFAGELERIEIGREQLSQRIVQKAEDELNPLGIELIDVQLKRISYEESVQQKVYSRMISERQRIAEKIRSFGKGEQAKIRGKTQKELERIQSNAYKTVQEIKGKAEGRATAIYAKSFQRDPKFFAFIRSLEAYEKTLPDQKGLLLSTDSAFWGLLKKGN